MDERRMVKVAKALADPTRLGIYQRIATSDEICCGHIARCFPVAAATVSHHLRILTEAGLVESRRNGQFIQFRVIPRTLDDYRRALGRWSQRRSRKSGHGR